MECPDDLDDIWLNCRALSFSGESVSAEKSECEEIVKNLLICERIATFAPLNVKETDET